MIRFALFFFIFGIGVVAALETRPAANANLPGKPIDRAEQKAARFFDRAQVLLSQQRYKKAAKFFRKAERRANNQRNKATAIVAQARCYEAMGKDWLAFSQYKKAVDEYPEQIPYADVLASEFRIASDLEAESKEEVLFFTVTTYGKAIDVYEHIARSAPYSKHSAESLYRSGLLYSKLRQYEDAAGQFSQIVSRYPRSDFVVDARIELARALLVRAKEADGDGTIARRAKNVLVRVIDHHPHHPRIEEARELHRVALGKEADRLLYLAYFYQRDPHRSPDASRRYLREIVANYQGSDAAEKAKSSLVNLELTAE